MMAFCTVYINTSLVSYVTNNTITLHWIKSWASSTWSWRKSLASTKTEIYLFADRTVTLHSWQLQHTT